MRHNGGWYNKDTTITLITTVIISILLGVTSPFISPGVNFPSQNLFSQIISQLPKNNLSEIDPMKSLGNVTGPLDNVWEALGGQLKGFLNSKDTSLLGPLKSSLGSGLGVENTSTAWKVLGIAKSALILTANILVAVLEVALGLLKGMLGLIR